MSFSTVRRITSQGLLAAAYVSCLLQWLWIATIGVPPLVKSGAFDGLINAQDRTQPIVQPQPVEMNPFLWALAILITIVMVAVTLMVILRLPATISKSGNRVVHAATNSIVPIVTHRHKIPAKKRRVISRRTRLAVQLTSVGLALLLSYFVPPYQEITRQIISLLASYLAGASAIPFIAAWLLEDTSKPTSRTRSRATRG